MVTVIAPGSHKPVLTDKFLLGLPQVPTVMWMPPQQPYWPAYSPHHLRLFLQRCLDSEGVGANPSLLFIGFSAGVVASIGVARWWQSQGGVVKAFIAIDGWGVPLYGDFPIHRVSHDLWTHCSSHLLGGTDVSFYAEPGVDHLNLWRSPHTTVGVSTEVPFPLGTLTTTSKLGLWPQSNILPLQFEETTITAAQFIHQLLQEYDEVTGNISVLLPSPPRQ